VRLQALHSRFEVGSGFVLQSSGFELVYLDLDGSCFCSTCQYCTSCRCTSGCSDFYIFSKMENTSAEMDVKFKSKILFRPYHGRPSISGPIRSIKMYSWAQCTMQERLVCSGDEPCVAQEEQGFGPSTLSTYPPPHLPGVVGTQFT
jgi:hypothetical protein